MNFLCVKDYNYPNKKYSIYSKLSSLMWCLKDRSQYYAFQNHSGDITRSIDACVNDSNEHLFTDIFVVYVFMQANNMKDIYNKEDMVWPKIVTILNSFATKDINRFIYYYSSLIFYYRNMNYSYLCPNDDYYYCEWDFNYEKMFKELLKDDPHTRVLLRKYSEAVDKIRELPKEVFSSVATALAIACSYCMITKNYKGYDDTVTNILANSETIHAKFEVNGIKEVINTKRYEGDHTGVESYVQYVLDLAKDNESGKTIK